MSLLQFKNINFSYDTFQVIDNFSLIVPEKKVTSILGPSGCGKTTLLRLTSGLENIQGGQIIFDKFILSKDSFNLSPNKRKIGYVFQDCALFPHLNVIENIRYALPKNSDKIKKKVDLILKQNDFQKFSHRYPHELSGGQKQLVALFRAIASDPKIILMDEPFSNLDTRLRESLRDQVLHILKENEITTLLVTHDADEAMFMSDFIALLNKGKLQQFGEPIELYMRPKNKFVTEFFGEINVLDGKFIDKKLVTSIGSFPYDYSGTKKKLFLVVRCEGLTLMNNSKKVIYGKTHKENIIKSPNNGRIIEAKFMGGNTMVHLSIVNKNNEQHLHVKIPGINYFEKNQLVNIFTDVNYSFIFES